ncbi:retrovirus-related Pol polyprotein from transposon TNT 1-94 [Senna tora]|uniref:Retrovirus-related Pol polyprotein from transposon TNT 1-94 n=1 Tax=Senna tora TaxID=362788 RepID=A0A834XFD3_9FABA|nr:retrovirus-related Pol polyprotein from transposon TNT 1-94 [Senna tora]
MSTWNALRLWHDVDLLHRDALLLSQFHLLCSPSSSQQPQLPFRFFFPLQWNAEFALLLPPTLQLVPPTSSNCLYRKSNNPLAFQWVPHFGRKMEKEQTSFSPGSLSSSNVNGALALVSKGTTSYFTHNISVKLDNFNYLLWRHQIMAALVGHGLENFIAGSEYVPEHFATIEDRTAKKVSEEYLSWMKQDQLIVSWLTSTMSESMGTKVLDCKHSYQVWDRVIQIFGINTRARVHQFKTELRSLKKGDRSMGDYLLRMKSISDSLAAIGSEVS